jgi:hypothetical protein
VETLECIIKPFKGLPNKGIHSDPKSLAAFGPGDARSKYYKACIMRSKTYSILLLLLIISNAFADDFQSDGSFQYKDVKLSVTAKPFNPKEHDIQKCKITSWEGVCLIDNKPVFGADMGMPKTMLNKAIVQVGAKVIPLDVTCMFNPWFKKPSKGQFEINMIEGGFAVRGFFSDGAGSYVAEWEIISGVSVRTILTSDETIYNHLSK